jgi:hypothetical protein
MILHVIIAMVAGWINRHQQQVIAYQQEEVHMFKAKLGNRRIRLSDKERRRLAKLAHPLGRKELKNTATIDATLKESGVKPVKLPPQSPNLNAHCERFIGSIKEEMINRMIFMGEASLRYALSQYVSHFHEERNHQGLNNRLITPEAEVGSREGDVKRRERLGGLLSYYYRQAA